MKQNLGKVDRILRVRACILVARTMGIEDRHSVA